MHTLLDKETNRNFSAFSDYNGTFPWMWKDGNMTSNTLQASGVYLEESFSSRKLCHIIEPLHD